MRAVVTRVASASVTIAGEVVGEIGRGFLVLLGVGPDDTEAQASLAAKGSLAPGDVSLYVGIPFCPTRCAYCSFISADAGRSLHMLEPYLDALCREVRAAGAALRRGGRRVRSVYFGGGTPTTLSAPQLDRLMGELEEAVDLSACVEYTVEAGRPAFQP